LILRVARQWRRAVDRRLQPFGLTEAMWLPLIYIARSSTPMRQKDLATALTVDGSSIVRLLDELEASHFIERREEATDRRAKIIVLTGAGRAIIEQVEDVSRSVRDRTLQGISERELATASDVFRRICDNLALQAEREE
jgi:MarR family transcriptional regulator for hemolysin